MRRGEVSLPLTYVYAVLIGIVVFIIAARIIGVQGGAATQDQQEMVLDYFDAVLDGFASNPNTIQNLTVDRLTFLLDWTDGSRIQVGQVDQLIRTPTFSEKELTGSIAAWTYPYSVEAPSVPLLFLSDGSIDYVISDGDDGINELTRDLPFNAGRYGLSIGGTDTPAGGSARDLCLNTNPSNPFDPKCDIKFSGEAPYGYVTWGNTWYPVVSNGALFAALFAADEASWVSAMEQVYVRDTVNREVLIERAEELNTGDCANVYDDAIDILVEIQDGFDPTDTLTNTPPLDDIDSITSYGGNVTELERANLNIRRAGCPAVI